MSRTTSHGVPAGSVVVGVDGSEGSRAALDWALGQAVAERRPLTLAHAEPAVGTHDGQAVLDEALDRVSAHEAPGLDVHRLLVVADPRELLIELSERASLVVAGSRGRGPVRSLLLGSVGVALVRHAAGPVVVVRPGRRGLVRQGVLVGADGREGSQAALEFAYRQASLRRMPLTVLHSYVDAIVDGYAAGVAIPSMMEVQVTDLEEERALLAESVSGLQEKYPDVRVRTETARGLPAQRLLEAASRMDLVVVGAHVGGTASEVLFGSVAVDVVEHADCPVAVVPRSAASS